MYKYAFFQPKNLQELQCVEYFAGVANVYKASYRAGFPSTAVDIEYLKDQEGKENPFDLLSNSGFAPEQVYGNDSTLTTLISFDFQ